MRCQPLLPAAASPEGHLTYAQVMEGTSASSQAMTGTPGILTGHDRDTGIFTGHDKDTWHPHRPRQGHLASSQAMGGTLSISLQGSHLLESFVSDGRCVLCVEGCAHPAAPWHGGGLHRSCNSFFPHPIKPNSV